MKVNRIHVEYYMKNGQTLTDDITNFLPVSDDEEEYIKAICKIKQLAEKALKTTSDGCFCMGNLYVLAPEIQAIRIEPVWDGDKQ